MDFGGKREVGHSEEEVQVVLGRVRVGMRCSSGYVSVEVAAAKWRLRSGGWGIDRRGICLKNWKGERQDVASSKKEEKRGLMTRDAALLNVKRLKTNEFASRPPVARSAI